MTTKINLVLVVSSIITIHIATSAKTDNSMTTANKLMLHNSDSTPSSNTITVAEAALPQKLLANFNRNFPAATNSKWTKTSTTFFVNFIMNGNTATAAFNTKGKFNYALIYESATDLPLVILQMIHKNYGSYTIFSVTEIRTRGIINYKVVLTDNKKYMDLKITQDGQVQEAKQVIMPS
jgi:hypothetical protein